LFNGLDQKALVDVQAHARLVRTAAGRAFFREGEPARVFYVLRRGGVKFTQVTSEGHRVILRLIGPGDPFGGVAAFVENALYPVTARVVEAAEAYAWDGPTMLGLMRRFPDVAINAARMIADRLRELQRQHRELMTERVERRIARALVRLAQGTGRRVDGGVEIDFPLSRQDLAQMTGTTLFTVSRTERMGTGRLHHRWTSPRHRQAAASVGADCRRPRGLNGNSHPVWKLTARKESMRSHVVLDIVNRQLDVGVLPFGLVPPPFPD
jgi:CRP-like cAMP-binding protein